MPVPPLVALHAGDHHVLAEVHQVAPLAARGFHVAAVSAGRGEPSIKYFS